MNKITIQQLNNLNKRFYSQSAAAFSETRQSPWQGWQLLVDTYLDNISQVRVLDIGCGNGRFGDFLSQQKKVQEYTGIDCSQELLQEAEETLKSTIPDLKLIQHDVVTSGVGSLSQEFDLVVMFGLLHHVPSHKNRISLINEALALQPSVLAFSLWQFANFERFRKKIVSWDVLPEIDQDELDEGDYLLDFSGSPPYRYCHSFSDEEVESIKSYVTEGTVASFQADGKEGYNKYVVISE